MGIVVKILLPLIVRLAAVVARKATPEIRQEIVDFVLEWEVRAKATPNKWDDILVGVAKGIFSMP